MSFETGDVVLAVVFFVIGWLAHIVWEWLLDMVVAATGHASSALWDLCAVVGVVTLAVGIGFAVTH